MQTLLRKIGNSTGIIVPGSILREIGVTTGAAMDLRVEDGRLIATPIRDELRKGWAEAAAMVAAAEEDPDESAWAAFGNDGDDAARW